MANKVFINGEAQIEIKKALSHYDEISTELSGDLLIKFQESVQEILNHPRSYPTIRGKYRKLNLERFPYKIVFRIEGNIVHVIAFAHHKRSPGYWRKR
jgi:toxin ParE1/3/4